MDRPSSKASLLSDRLIRFGGRVCGVVRRAPREPMLESAFRQLARSATSPAANYAEAREAVSSRDYIYKLKTCVKELRETMSWLQMVQAAGYRTRDLQPLIEECDELVAICVACVRKASGNVSKQEYEDQGARERKEEGR